MIFFFRLLETGLETLSSRQLEAAVRLKPASTRFLSRRKRHFSLTLTARCWTRAAWHRMLLVLQQPVQRFTSTQGGQMMKLAEVGSTWLLGIS